MRSAWGRSALRRWWSTPELRPLTASPLFPIDPVPAWVDALPADLASRAAWVVDVAGFLVGTFVGHPVMDRITAADHVVEGKPARIAVPDRARALRGRRRAHPGAR